MPKRSQAVRTHRKHELAPARPPVMIGVVMVLIAVAAFLGLSELLN